MDFPVVPDEDFLTGRQTCDQLGITPMRLNRLVGDGTVRLVSNRAKKRGYSQANIDTLLASGADLGPAGPPTAKGIFRKARRKVAELGLDRFFDSLG